MELSVALRRERTFIASLTWNLILLGEGNQNQLECLQIQQQLLQTNRRYRNFEKHEMPTEYVEFVKV